MWTLISGRFALHKCCSHITTLFRTQNISQTTCKNTVVVERWWQVPLSKEGSPPRLYSKRHEVYRLVEDTKHKSQSKMELILTQTVPKFGGRGDTVFVKKSLGRNKLLPQGLAVYPSPENKRIYAEERRLLREGKIEERIQTWTAEKTIKFLMSAKLEIGVPIPIQHQLTKEVVCRRFLQLLGVVVPEHALTLPEEPIKDLGDYWCEVTVNGMDTVRVPMTLVPFVEPRLRKLQKQEEDQPNTE
ncbi:large ribosomal subunit protein bL9m [Brachyhypopomus gauderio]|uniref:large ribosomal subunit protein bL9m n=1 Tax=Brachyhypopomus gauderio TaxID=698409 RepID=UPI0040418B00